MPVEPGRGTIRAMPTIDHIRSDGIVIPVEIFPGPDRPLLFLPGFGVHPLNYRDGVALLSRHFTVFVPDLSFRSHRELPDRVEAYLAIVDRMADRWERDAPRAGHSFGGLLALLGDAPAAALAPMIPLHAGWPAKIRRALLLQLREYAGLEGVRGIRWAFHIAGDYVRTAAFRPHCLFPAVSETLGGIPDHLLPTAPRSVIVLARRDQLYKRSEYDAYFARVDPARIVVRMVPHGHDWPVTHPDVVERETLAALGAGALRAGTGTS